jgi:hypothetical protein
VWFWLSDTDKIKLRNGSERMSGSGILIYLILRLELFHKECVVLLSDTDKIKLRPGSERMCGSGFLIQIKLSLEMVQKECLVLAF